MFTDEERRIFPFLSLDRATTIYSDPGRVHRRLRDFIGAERMKEAIEQYNGSSAAERSAAIDSLAPGVIYAFELQEFNRLDATGWTEAEAMDLLCKYMAWRKDVKKNGEMTPTTSPFMDGQTDSSQTMNAGSPLVFSEIGS